MSVFIQILSLALSALRDQSENEKIDLKWRSFRVVESEMGFHARGGEFVVVLNFEKYFLNLL
jgi:hypothetical protein